MDRLKYAYRDQPEKALALVERWAKQEIEGCKILSTTGITLYTPDGLKNYNALWTRDYTYMIEYAGEYIPLEDILACNEYLLEHAREGDCWLPDRVYANGTTAYAAGDMPKGMENLDNNSFIVIAMDYALNRMEPESAKELFVKWEKTIMTAHDCLPKDENGLIWNDPQCPHSPYGFTDCIQKTGSLMKESLLLWRAYRIMAKWQSKFNLPSDVSVKAAKKIENVLVDMFKNDDGMFNAATVDCKQTDVWGSCYAVSIGFPMPEKLKASIADYLAANYEGLVQFGQLRHTAPGTCWEKLLLPVKQGEYQNGAYWATPTSWFIDALYDYYPDLARTTLEDIITYFENMGIFECINGSYQKLNHYVVSATNILPSARKLLKNKI